MCGVSVSVSACFVAKDEQRRILVECHAPDDLPIQADVRVISSWLGLSAVERPDFAERNGFCV